MRQFFFSVILFVALAIAFSSFSACTNHEGSDNVAVSGAPKPPVSSPSAEPTKSIYPPIATKVAQADIKNLDGTTFKVADKKGKVILLNMWATWCGPCRAEMPALVRMQEKHRDAGFEVIGLDTDDDDSLEEINEFAQKMKLNYTLAWADTDLQAALVNITKFPGIPQSFLIDRDGNLRGIFKGASEVAQMEELVEMVVTGQETPIVAESKKEQSEPAQSEGSAEKSVELPASKEKAVTKEKK